MDFQYTSHLLLGRFTFKIRPLGWDPKELHICAALTSHTNDNAILTRGPKSHLSCDHWYIDTENWADG